MMPIPMARKIARERKRASPFPVRRMRREKGSRSSARRTGASLQPSWCSMLMSWGGVMASMTGVGPEPAGIVDGVMVYVEPDGWPLMVNVTGLRNLSEPSGTSGSRLNW